MTQQSTKRGLEETTMPAMATAIKTVTMTEVVTVTAKKTMLTLLKEDGFPLPLAAMWSYFGNSFFAIRSIWSIFQIFQSFSDT
jgi:hypothetical protein